jgi:carboxypeptidase C (cathepsin A)
VASQVSNIIFVDSPVGTGFSYAKSEEGLETGDTKQVKQLVIFLRKVRAFCTNQNTNFCLFCSEIIIVVCSGSKTIPGS